MTESIKRDARMPFGKQFSPTQIELSELLALADEHAGACGDFEQAVLARYFSGRPTSQKTLAMNTRLAMQQYGLLDSECRLTKAAIDLATLREKPGELHAAFGTHVLLRCYGNQLLQAIRTLRDRGVELTAPTIAEELARMGIDPGGRGGEKLNPMRLWLERAGVFARGWEIDEQRSEALLGLPADKIDALSGLNAEQRTFLRALAGLPAIGRARSSAEIARLAEQQSPVRFDVKQLPKKVLFPLEEAGFIVVTKTTEGRGAKPYLVEGTDRLVADVVESLLASLEGIAQPIDPRILRRPLTELLGEVRDTTLSTDRRGKALEGVALQVVLALRLEFEAWRKRAPETGGAEVDLTASQTNGRFAIWQLQCKVSSITGREPVDREMGVAQHVHSNVIAFVTAGTVGAAARKASDSYMMSTGINVVFVDGSDLNAIAAGTPPSAILDREFARAKRIRAGRRGGD